MEDKPKRSFLWPIVIILAAIIALALIFYFFPPKQQREISEPTKLTEGEEEKILKQLNELDQSAKDYPPLSPEDKAKLLESILK